MVYVQADVIPSIKDWLSDRQLGAEVRQNIDTHWKPTDPPVLIVADDGGPATWPIASEHTIRLTAYAGGRDEARRIVALAAGSLAASRPRPAGVAAIESDMSTILDTRDKDTGALLASILMTVHAKMVPA